MQPEGTAALMNPTLAERHSELSPLEQSCEQEAVLLERLAERAALAEERKDVDAAKEAVRRGEARLNLQIAQHEAKMKVKE